MDDRLPATLPVADAEFNSEEETRHLRTQSVRAHMAERAATLRQRLTPISGFEDEHTRHMLEAFNSLRQAGAPTLAPLLPMLLSLKGKPYSLRDHFPFEPFFRTAMPEEVVLMTGRQVSKCVDVDTPIELWDGGSKPAGDIRAGDMITAWLPETQRFGPRRVLRVFPREPRAVWLLRTRWGRDLALSPDHRVWVRDRDNHEESYREAKDIGYGDYVAVRCGDDLEWDRVNSCWPSGELREMVDFEVEQAHNFLAHDIITHNSTSLAAQGIIFSAAVPYFSTLYVTPLFEMVRRFSHQYMRQFIETSPVRRLLAGGKTLNSVLQKSFVNGSTMYFSYAFLDAERTRGIPGDRLVVDESVVIGTMVPYPGGAKPIETFQPGDPLWSFDRKGTIHEDEVVACSDHGVRDCYRLDFSDGSFVEGTSDAIFATSAGWKRISNVIDDLNRRIGADAVGHDAGRRFNDCPQITAGQSDILQPARVEAARLQLPEVHRVIWVREQPTQESEELRLRQMVESLVHQAIDTLAPYRFFVLPQRQEARESEVAGPTDLGGNRLVVPGRRLDQQRQKQGGVQHARLRRKGSRLAVSGLSEAGARQSRARMQAGAVRSDVQEGERQPIAAGARLVPVNLVRITWIGKRRVFDLETKKHQAFFPGGVAGSNCQDLNIDFLPIMEECLSGSPWGLKQRAGTPKSLDNTLTTLWQDSSQAEFVVRCQTGGCNHFNVPLVTHDLWGMIGKWNSDISEASPGVVCAKCRKPLDPRRFGRWVHFEKERRHKIAGYHVPQILMPMHYADPRKWLDLHQKLKGKGGFTLPVFLNEVCGIPWDEGSKLITLTDLKQAACMPWTIDWRTGIRKLKTYKQRVLGVDWGGGGGRLRTNRGAKDEKRMRTSFTTLAVLGMHPTGRVDVLWGYRSPRTYDAVWEAKLCAEVMAKFGCSHMAHDYNGAGATREVFARQAGIPFHAFLPMRYHGAASHNVMVYHAATRDHPRNWYSLDRTYVLTLVCECIKHGLLRFFQDDYVSADMPGLLRDFLSLIEEKVDSRLGTDVFAVTRNPNKPDDFAHAVTYGCCALWRMTKRWPDLATAANMRMNPKIVEQFLHPSTNVNWEDLP